jgi:hypothetical protein
MGDVLTLVPKEALPNGDVAERLRGLLALAEAGKLRAFVGFGIGVPLSHDAWQAGFSEVTELMGCIELLRLHFGNWYLEKWAEAELPK